MNRAARLLVTGLLLVALGASVALAGAEHGELDGDVSRSLSEFWEGWEYYQTGALAGLAVGAMLGLLGVYVVLRRLVFLSAAIGQTASFGVVLSLYLAAHLGGAWWLPSPNVAAIGLTALATFVVINRRGRATVFRDGLLGAMFLVGAAGTELLGNEIPQERHQIEGLLHGIGVAVPAEDLAFVAALSVVVGLVHVFAWRGFSAVSFDPLGAAVRRVPVRALDLLLALSLAAAIAGGIRALGALPVFALSILPSLAAVRLAANLPQALVIGAVFGAVAAFVGYVLSFLYDFPVGASQTVTALALVAITELVRRIVDRLDRAATTAGPTGPTSNGDYDEGG